MTVWVNFDFVLGILIYPLFYYCEIYLHNFELNLLFMRVR